jgi:excisionase family DNA binding protein
MGLCKRNSGSNSDGGGGSGGPRRALDGGRLCLTVPEAAAMLGISRNFAYEMVKQKQLPVIKFGKRLLIPKAALERMLEGGAPA